jgi:hypothetical protein
MTFLLVLLTYVVVSHNNANPFNPANAPGFPYLSFLWTWSSSSYLNKKGSDPSRFNFHLHLPSHFTIPILSPWASVVSVPHYFMMKLRILMESISFSPLFVQVENQTSNTISASTSSSFYNILIISLLCISVSSVIIWKYNRGQHDHLDEKHFDSQRLLHSSSILQILGHVLNPGLSSIAFWTWVWNWTYKLLRLIGFAPR